MTWKPWQLFAVAIAGLMNRQQQDAIVYLKEENRILREKLGHRKIILDVSQKRRLARAAVRLGKDALRDLGTIFTPETLLRWHHWYIAHKYDGNPYRRKPGPQPSKTRQVQELVIRLATENRDWGYGRIHGELKTLGYDVSWQTVRRILKDQGLLNDPKDPPRMKWKDFLASHWESIAACDFFTVEAWGAKGLTRYLVYFVIDIASRKVEIAGIHSDPCEIQMIQYARNLTDAHDGFLNGKRVLIHDRDPLYTDRFRETLEAAGVRALKLPKHSPNLNAYAESFVRTIKRECLDKMMLFGESHVRYVIGQFMEHYHLERPHKTLGRRIIEPKEPPPRDGEVLCRQRLGGLLKAYYREAA